MKEDKLTNDTFINMEISHLNNTYNYKLCIFDI
jgi:hypothetical protein